MEIDVFHKDLINKFKKDGSEKFYQFLLFTAINKIVERQKQNEDIDFINIDYLNLHDKFLIFFRRENEEVYLKIAKSFRKAANKIYRHCLKQGFCELNNKFLNVV